MSANGFVVSVASYFYYTSLCVIIVSLYFQGVNWYTICNVFVR